MNHSRVTSFEPFDDVIGTQKSQPHAPTIDIPKFGPDWSEFHFQLDHCDVKLSELLTVTAYS